MSTLQNGITEIEVLDLTLKTPELDDTVLRAIDQAIPFPLLFQLQHNASVRFAAAYKRPSDADASKWVIEAAFQTDWLPRSSVELQPLPVALDLAGLYDQLIRRYLPLPPRSGESIRDHVARWNAIQAGEKERARLQSRLRAEKQFNRKVELNSALRALGEELAELSGL